MSGLDQHRRRLKSEPQKIKAFLLQSKWKEVLIFSGFILLAFGFWLLQSMQEEYEIEISVPVRYRNLPVDITFTEPAPDKITVRLKDKGSVLMNYSFGRKFAPIEKNFRTKDQQAATGVLAISANELEADIQKQLIATTRLVEFEPSQINVPYGKRTSKALPVVFDGKIDLEPGFQLSGDILINPAVINAYATKAILDSTSRVRTAYTEFRSVNKTITKTIQLRKTGNLFLEKETVTVTIPVDEYSEKTLDIPVECTGIPADYTVRLMPHMVKVGCHIPISRFKELTENQFAIRIPFGELERNLSGIISVELTRKPDWISAPTLSPNKIEFVIEQNGE